MDQRSDDDWLMRQIKGFAQSLKVLLAGGGGKPQVEIILPALSGQTLPYQGDLEKLLKGGRFGDAVAEFTKVHYAMPEPQYLRLGAWFYAELAKFSDTQLLAGGTSKKALQEGLRVLQQLVDDAK